MGEYKGRPDPIGDSVRDPRQPWWWRKVVGPSVNRINKSLLDQGLDDAYTSDLSRLPTTDACRFRRESHCWFPKELDEDGTRMAGYAVWTPHDRGSCPRGSHALQKECEVYEPGPDSGEQSYGPDGTRSWADGGQRYSAD